jgi:ABC-type polar amino acid transport system ATPase subunit
MLSARGLTKTFGRYQVLRGVDIDVLPGRTTLLVGPNGSGKTTLLKCLAFLLEPDAGQLTFQDAAYCFPRPEGQVVAPPWPALTVVFQQHFLWPHLTIRQNILLPRATHPEGTAERFDELMSLFDMSHFIDRYPNQTSGGQRQRAALARAMILDPKIMLLDEITSALDIEQTAKILSVLMRLRERGIGMLLITHQLDFARRLLGRGEGDRIVFLDGGNVLESGGIEVIDRPQNARVRQFMSQMDSV